VSSIVVSVFVATEKRLSRRYLAMAASIRSTTPVFSSHNNNNNNNNNNNKNKNNSTK
jgi:hypothetical protein